MQFYLHKVEHIDTSDQTCHIEYGLSMWWKSDEIKGKLCVAWVRRWHRAKTFAQEHRKSALRSPHPGALMLANTLFFEVAMIGTTRRR